jgi:hypothetical protein
VSHSLPVCRVLAVPIHALFVLPGILFVR